MRERDAKLDAEVAQRVMGWTTPPVVRVDTTQDFYDGDKWHMNWSPSSDPAAAWMVVEKMRAMGWGFSITDPWKGKFRTLFTRDPAKVEIGVCEVPSGPDVMPLAVCTAALAALAGKEKA